MKPGDKLTWHELKDRILDYIEALNDPCSLRDAAKHILGENYIDNNDGSFTLEVIDG
jgi:hypothetical protein